MTTAGPESQAVGINGHPALGEGERYDTKITPGKIFIGGLASDCTEADVKEYFGAYGTITDVVVMKDKLTGQGRGFGFLTFADGNVADRVVAQRHEIKGRSVEAKSAVPRTEGEVQSRQAARGGQFGGGGMDMGDQRSSKVFVGGLSPSCDDEAFKNYFGGYGKIVDSQVPHPPHPRPSPRATSPCLHARTRGCTRVLRQPACMVNPGHEWVRDSHPAAVRFRLGSPAIT